MSLQKKPGEAVSLLLEQLRKAKELILQEATTEDANEIQSLSSKFEDTERELKSMEDIFPKIKNWENTVVNQFCALEQELDNDIFKNPNMKSEVKDKLDLMQEGIRKLRSLIPAGILDRISKLRSISFSPADQAMDGTIPNICQDWVDLDLERKILGSDLSSFFKSFHCLSGSQQAKMCSMCLSVFPLNSVVQKKPLIYWWIGEGLVTRRQNKTAEEVGEQVFQELLDEGFIKASNENRSLGVSSFVIDPWIHRMLILKAKEQFLDFSPQGEPCNGKQREFLYSMRNGGSEVNGEDVVMVFNVNDKYLRMKKERLANLKKVEVLQMGRWQHSVNHHIEVENQSLFDGLGSQKHLKYLSLRGISRVETLPDSISKLISLKILDLRACHNLERLPATISKLSYLTHLDVSQCYLLESMPRGVEQLAALEVVKGFVIGKSETNSCKIRDLSRLRYLRKLSIRVGNLGVKQHEEQLGSLHTLPALCILTIWFGDESLAKLNTFSFPQTLTKLDLRCVPFQEAPAWLFPSKLPSNLVKLYIQGGKLNTLEKIDVKDMMVKYLRFNHLQHLKINQPGALPNYRPLEKHSFYEYSFNVASSTPAPEPIVEQVASPQDRRKSNQKVSKSIISRLSKRT